jgi:hypothetical protein
MPGDVERRSAQDPGSVGKVIEEGFAEDQRAKTGRRPFILLDVCTGWGIGQNNILSEILGLPQSQDPQPGEGRTTRSDPATEIRNARNRVS